MNGKEKSAIIECFLRFATVNLDDPVERGRGAIFAFLSEGSPFDISALVGAASLKAGLLSPVSEIDRQRLEGLQKKTRECLNWIVEHLVEDRQLVFEIPVAFIWHDTFAYVPDERVNQPLRAQLYEIDGAMRSKPLESFEFPAYFRMLFEALDGFKKNALCRCPKCDKIFFNPTRRKKTYCSPRCQNTAGVRRLRDKKGKG